MDSSSPSNTTGFRLPDLISHCPFKPIYHKNGDIVAATSENWLKEGCRALTEDMRRHLHEVKAGQLAAYCYNECEDDRLRVVCDILSVWWLLDDLSEELKTSDTEVLADVMMNALTFPQFYKPTHAAGKEQPEEEPDASRLTRDYWTRCISKAGPRVQARYVQNFELFLIAVDQEVMDRISGAIPSPADYIKRRQISSACKAAFDLLEYSLDMELPDYVIENPNLESMKDCVNNLVSWSNDIFSYNVEQSRGITHNIITVIMKHYNMDLQAAVDHAGNMCIEAIESYCEYKTKLPSYGPEIDRQVAAYTRGLESWISGSLEWSFLAQRYFGKRCQEIKKHRWVSLLSPSQLPANAA